MKTRIGGGKLRDNIAHLQRWANGEGVGPLTVEVSPTHGCNHGCIHCGFQQFEPYSSKYSYLNLDAFQRFCDDFKALGGIEVFFAGNGEPLLHPLFPELVRYGHEIGLNMTLSTNGVPLIEKVAEKILPRLQWIRFSVNGGDAKTYARVHACEEQDFNKLIQNLETAVQYKRLYQLEVKLIIQFIFYDLNWGSADQMVALHKSIGTDLLIFRHAIFENRQSSVSTEDMLKLLTQYEGNDKIEVRRDTFQRDNNCAWNKCYGINFRTNMDHKGNLITCNRNSLKESVYGNIHTQRFKDIWESSFKKKMFREIESGCDRNLCAAFCQTSYDNIFAEDFLKANLSSSHGYPPVESSQDIIAAQGQ